MATCPADGHMMHACPLWPASAGAALPIVFYWCSIARCPASATLPTTYSEPRLLRSVLPQIVLDIPPQLLCVHTCASAVQVGSAVGDAWSTTSKWRLLFLCLVLRQAMCLAAPLGLPDLSSPPGSSSSPQLTQGLCSSSSSSSSSSRSGSCVARACVWSMGR